MGRARLLWLLLAAALGGCAPRAQMLVFRPAGEDLAGFERLTILEFEGPEPQASAARQAVVAVFAENRSYTLVEPWVLARHLPVAAASAEFDQAGAILATQHAGVDAILRCQVVSENPSGRSSGARFELAATLADARTGQILASRQIRGTGVPREGASAEAAAQACAAELVALLAPHDEPVEVVLARQWWGQGRRRVAAGNVLARQGDWEGAAAEWEEARRADPGNHAALHNLALAAEQRQDYREAFKLLDRALAQFPAKLYHRTRREMEERQTKFLAACRQVENIRAAALR
jgi:tetratricopeptide (TPR) repeat protein